MSTDFESMLLKRFEPILRFTRGEQFFPVDVDSYVARSSLWMQPKGSEAHKIVQEGSLTLDKLADLQPQSADTIYYLRFVEPLNLAEMARYQVEQGLKRKKPEQVFKAGRGRLARVGYGSRFIDALFSLTLLARGRVPGDTAAAASQEYAKMLNGEDRYSYYGRVVYENGWIVLQYWYFYAFNNWRSGFFGVNDHESDWEQVCIYCYETDAGDVAPAWVAYASHDFSGDDLRRRWDDEELEKAGEHPIVYPGAGSHASYYQQGEYLAEIEIPFLRPLVKLVDAIQEWSRNTLSQYWPAGSAGDEGFNVFRIPFVDYGRGDGVVIGPGGDKEWTDPLPLDPVPGWAMHYRGLWGLYTADPLAGEDAPAGPLYNRDGSVRQAWYDPLGWAGLDKVPPPNLEIQQLNNQHAEIIARIERLEVEIETKSEGLRSMGIEAAAMQGLPHLTTLYAAKQAEIKTLAAEVDTLRAQMTTDQALLEALELHARRIDLGQLAPVRAHIHRAHHPASDSDLRVSRLAEFWAAISIGLSLIAFVVLVIFARHYLIVGLIAIAAALIFFEAMFRRQFARLISIITWALALAGVILLLVEFFWTVVVIAVIIAGGYIMWENLRELWS